MTDDGIATPLSVIIYTPLNVSIKARRFRRDDNVWRRASAREDLKLIGRDTLIDVNVGSSSQDLCTGPTAPSPSSQTLAQMSSGRAPHIS